MQTLRQKTILITGGTGLLGSRFAAGFVKAGSNVVVIDINESPVTLPEDALFFKADVTHKESWYEIKEYLASKKLVPDVLINNACTKSENFFTPFEEFPMEDWQAVMNVNLNAAVLGCQVIGTEMAKRRKGSIINIASIYGMVAPDQRIYKGSEYHGRQINTPAVYSASKAALIGLTKYLASYWGLKNVRVNTVVPGGVFSGQNETFVRRYSEKVPLGRMATTDDVYGAVQYLASDTSSYVTGQNIVVDGGWTVW